MKESNHPLTGKFSDQIGHQTLQKNRLPPSWGKKEQTHGTQLVGIERGNRLVRRFKLIFKTGRMMSIPYAHLPIFTYAPEGILSIETTEMTVLIHGRSLNLLADYFSEEKVLFVKESPSGIDNEDMDIFIKQIEWDKEDVP